MGSPWGSLALCPVSRWGGQGLEQGNILVVEVIMRKSRCSAGLSDGKCP